MSATVREPARCFALTALLGMAACGAAPVASTGPPAEIEGTGQSDTVVAARLSGFYWSLAIARDECFEHAPKGKPLYVATLDPWIAQHRYLAGLSRAAFTRMIPADSTPQQRAAAQELLGEVEAMNIAKVHATVQAKLGADAEAFCARMVAVVHTGHADPWTLFPRELRQLGISRSTPP